MHVTHKIWKIYSGFYISWYYLHFRGVSILLWISFGYIHSEVLRLPDCGKYHASFDVVYPQKSLNGSLIWRFFGISWDDCNENCMLFGRCKSMNFIDDGKTTAGICEINNREVQGKESELVDRTNSYYVETPIFGKDNQRKVRLFIWVVNAIGKQLYVWIVFLLTTFKWAEYCLSDACI